MHSFLYEYDALLYSYCSLLALSVSMKAQPRRCWLAYTESHYTVSNKGAVVQERERKLQTNLVTKIDRFLRGDTDGFALTLMNEAQRLSEAAYGSAFLHTIGSVITCILCSPHVVLSSPHLVGDVPAMQYHELQLDLTLAGGMSPTYVYVIAYITICPQADICRLANAWTDLQILCCCVLVNNISHQSSSSPLFDIFCTEADAFMTITLQVHI